MIDMKLTRRYFEVKDVRFGDKCAFLEGVLTVCEEELRNLTADLCKAVKCFRLEITKPHENARIVHVLDTICPMVKTEGEGQQYSGFFSTPFTVGRGVTNVMKNPEYQRPALSPGRHCGFDRPVCGADSFCRYA